MASEPSNLQTQGADPSPSSSPSPATATVTATAPSSDHQLVVNLQVVSPSVGVNRPLFFPSLSAATTIKQLKEKIRETLPLRPADENQRLIHRGRALLRETDSLLDIFGADTLRSPDQQTIHLVIRDVSDIAPSTPSSMAGTQNTAPALPPLNVPRQNHPHTYFGPLPPPGLARRSPFQPTPTTALPQPRMPSPARSHSPAHTPEQAAAFQQQHQNMTHWLTHLQREAMARAIVNQNQRGRAHLGMRGIGDTAANNPGHAPETNSGRASPAPTHTIYRETVGPNGQSYHVETIIRTSGPSASSAPSVPSAPPAPSASAPQGGLSPTEVHNILRGADSNQNSVNMANALHRSASGNSLQNRPLTQPGVTTSVFATAGSRASSGRVTPDQGLRPVATGLTSHPSTLAPQPFQPRQAVEVYLLSSPEGPRAILFNNNTSETYYTPRLVTQHSYPHLRNMAMFPNLNYAIQPQTRDDVHHQIPQIDQRQVLAQQQQQQQEHQQQPQQPAVLPIHPHNPPAGVLPALLMQIAPHIWLIVRLALFVWFFTSSNASWSRWLTAICIAVFMFALSTGLLNEIAEHAWRPLGRHLENVFPVGDPERIRREAAAGRGSGAGAGAGAEAGAGAGTGEHGQDPDPALLAARLVAERQRESWLVGQLRRLERACLLFLASIAPGVAERHIANLEAEARAEENRRREAREAEAAAAAAAVATNEQSNGDNVDEGDGNQDGQEQPERPEEQGEQGEQQDTQRGEAIREELVAL